MKQPGQTLYSRFGDCYITLHAAQGHILLSCYSSKGARLWTGEMHDKEGLWDGKGWDVVKLSNKFKKWRRDISKDNNAI